MKDRWEVLLSSERNPRRIWTRLAESFSYSDNRYATFTSFDKKIQMLKNNYYYSTHLRIFHTSVRWWFSTGTWVTASLLKSPELFSGFWPISTMLLYGWSPFVLLFLSSSVSVLNLWWLYRMFQLQLVST